jgi:hypothetical protein
MIYLSPVSSAFRNFFQPGTMLYLQKKYYLLRWQPGYPYLPGYFHFLTGYKKAGIANQKAIFNKATPAMLLIFENKVFYVVNCPKTKNKRKFYPAYDQCSRRFQKGYW